MSLYDDCRGLPVARGYSSTTLPRFALGSMLVGPRRSPFPPCCSLSDAAAKALVDGLMNSNCYGTLATNIGQAIKDGQATMVMIARFDRFLQCLACMMAS